MILLSSVVMALFINLTVADGPYNSNVGKITWAASRDSNWEVYIMNADGTGKVRLTFDPPGGTVDQHPVFTPDGSKIVWTRSMNIWIMNPDGTGKTQLTTTGLDNHPFVANVPGIGLKIYFNREAPNGARLIMSMNMDGSGVTQLTDNTKSRWHPIVRESDGLIVYAVDTDFDRIGEYAATFNQTSNVETIIYNPGWKVSAPHFKPDGSKIVLIEDHDGDVKYRIVTINPDGTGHTVLTTGALHDTTPYYRYPTGDKIVFARDIAPPNREIYTMNEDGTGVTRLTTHPTADTFVVEKASCNPVPPEHRKHLDAEPPELIDLKHPVSTQWHELYPNYSRYFHLSSWLEYKHRDYKLGPCDYIILTDKDTGKVAWYHVERVTVTITLTLKPHLNYTMYLEFNGTQDEFLTIGDPRSTWWHEVWPDFSKWWHILTWTDTDGSGNLTVSDQVDFADGSEWHVDAVKTDIIVTKKRPGDVNGDGIVDIVDVVIAAIAFGSMAVDDPTTLWNETKNWDPDADLNGDGLIDIIDLVIIGVNFGKTNP
ncbi:MAG: hypothetical protein ACE5J6_02000 [Candidatus Bathyarchaeia archaeon]